MRQECFEVEDEQERESCFLVKGIHTFCGPVSTVWAKCISGNQDNISRCNWLAEELIDCMKHSVGPLTRTSPN